MSTELFFSLSTRFCSLVLLCQGQLVHSFQQDNLQKHSETFLPLLNQFLKDQQLTLEKLDKIYFTSTPGGQTGIRVSLSFLVALKVLHPQLEIFHLDSLLFQAGNENCYSLLSANNRNSKYFFALCQQGKIIEKGMIEAEQLNLKLSCDPQLVIKKDFSGIDFTNNFLILKEKFVPLDSFDLELTDY